MQNSPDSLNIITQPQPPIERPQSDYMKTLEIVRESIPQEKEQNMAILNNLKNAGLNPYAVLRFFEQTKNQPLSIRQTASEIYLNYLESDPDRSVDFSFKAGVFNSGRRPGEGSSYSIFETQVESNERSNYEENNELIDQHNDNLGGNFIIVDTEEGATEVYDENGGRIYN